MRTGIHVYEAMKTKPICARLDDSAKKCAELMYRRQVGSVMIKDGKHVKGMITEYDLVKNVVARDRSSKKTKCKDIMCTDMITINADKDIYDALIEMKVNDVRHLPVLDGKKVIGFISMKDILRMQPQLLDIVTEKTEINGDRKPLRERIAEEGICPTCGNYTDSFYSYDGWTSCLDCLKEQYPNFDPDEDEE
ncbi:CBS domain-containing protein [Candidatus Woesearchaeota archaeon]|nr:CBS domain-containing protein [Candidatus Woesearchaeota archaeon]